MAERRDDTTLACSWIPTTPAKPSSAKEQLIFSNRDGNQPGSQEIQKAINRDVSACSSDPFNVNGGMKGSGVVESQVYTEVLSSFDTWQANNVDQWANMSFSDLLAMADASAKKGVGCGGKFTITNMDNLQAGNLGGVTNVPNAVWGGTSCDENFLPGTCLSSLEPITPEKNRKGDQRHGSAATYEFRTYNGHTTKEAVHNMIAREEITEHREMNEQSHLVSASKPTEQQEIHKLDKEGTDEADLGKTPQQKPRRRKHRPKVVRQGATKNTHIPSPEKPLVPQETPRVKRKYVRRKGVQNSINSLSGVGVNETDSNNKGSIANGNPVSKGKCTGHKSVNKPDNMNARSSCKRSLNFDLESQIREESSVYGSSKCNIESRVESCTGENQSRTAVESVRVKEVIREKNDTVIGNGMTHSRHQGVDDYSSNAVHCQNDFLPRDPSVSVKGKCKIVFSDVTNDKETNTVQVTANTRVQCMSMATDSIGSSSLLIPEKQPEGMQSVVDRTAKAKQDSKDATETAPKLQDCYANGIQLPLKSGQQLFEELMALEPRKKTRKRSYNKSPAQVQDLNSKLPILAKKSKPARKNGQHTNEEACKANTSQVETKLGHNQHEFSTRSSGQPLAISWECLSTVDSIVHQLNQLYLDEETSQNQSAFSGDHIHYQTQCATVNLNKETSQNQSAISADHIHYQTQCAIVPYQTGGAVIPFDVSFGLVKRKRPRPKVELDDETNRVWKLLLENINSEGVDGTDEGNTKWWDEERRVFQGRADSFIARMHLVQGDRRFSPWKGSVVDSVVGVFLTQNVSDHLSSSAFMSLAARFPLKEKTVPADLHETSVSTKINEPEVCVLDSEDTSGSNKKSILDHLRLDDAKLDHDIEDGDIDSFDDGIPKEGFRDTSECSPVISHVSDCNKLISLNVDGHDMDEAVSSQASVISSQNSADSLIHQTTESEEPSSSVRPNRFSSSVSFVELLQMAGTVLHGVYENCNGQEEYDGNQKEKPESSPIHSQQSGVSAESVSQAKMKFTFASSKQSTDNDKISLRPKAFENQIGQVQPPGHSQGITCNTDLPDTSTCPQNLMDVTGSNSNVDVSRRSEHDEVHSKNGPVYYPGETVNGPKSKGGKIGKEKQKPVDWDGLRRDALNGGGKKERTINTMDSVDWEAVRSVDVGEIADSVKERGMNNKLAERIQAFLNRIVRDHGSIDLEWLREVAPDKAKEYLLSVRGLGLKSVECVRLLTLHQLAFPVDTNVGRIAVRLGWVPLQPLPESLQLHLLELYPILEAVQKYLWPRLCKLDQRTLYELHYQMITFGKVFCTKSKPNCNACPMRGECRHFASAFASARLALPAPTDKSIVAGAENKSGRSPKRARKNTLQLPSPQTYHMAVTSGASSSQPIIEEPKTPEPITEMPASPEQNLECDIEDMLFEEDPDDIPTIHLNMEQFTHNLHKVMEQNTEL